MREEDIHKLIEAQDPEVKARIWARTCERLGLDIATGAPS